MGDAILTIPVHFILTLKPENSLARSLNTEHQMELYGQVETTANRATFPLTL